MIYTEPSGRGKVRCDSCAIEIEHCGWIAHLDGEEVHVCDECSPMFDCRHEFRICDVCGDLMVEGYVTEDGSVHLCDGCFKPWMDEYCPGGWRANGHDDLPLWNGGYYDELVDGEWTDTGIYWTEWY